MFHRPCARFSVDKQKQRSDVVGDPARAAATSAHVASALLSEKRVGLPLHGRMQVARKGGAECSEGPAVHSEHASRGRHFAQFSRNVPRDTVATFVRRSMFFTLRFEARASG
ncbi:hypothetical protein MRX96_058393 [Rhipicephalus microplus]